MKINVEKSRELAKSIEVVPRKCWLNCYAILEDDEPTNPQLLYVEGWVITRDWSIMAHAWLEARGEILDPTLCEHPPRAYCFAAGYGWDELQEHLNAELLKPPFPLTSMLEPDLWHFVEGETQSQALDRISDE